MRREKKERKKERKKDGKKGRNSVQAHGKWRNSSLLYRVPVLRVPVLILKLPCTSGYAYELRLSRDGTLLFRKINRA